MVGTLVLVRHAECTWNVQDLFTGWYDSPLTDLGNSQALTAGELIRNYGVIIGRAHTSVLTRAVQTCEIILKQSDQECVPIYKHWRLNECHFGALTGLNKNDVISEFGEEQVLIWRKSFKCPPPAMDCKHKYFKEIVYDSRYDSDPPRIGFPLRESVEATFERVKVYWQTSILNDLKDRHNILVIAHNRSIAAIIRILDNLSDEETSDIELLNGVPMVYELNENFQPKEPIKILGDEDTIVRAYEGLPKSMKGKKYYYGPRYISGLTCE